MDIAIFTESYTPAMGAKRRQVLITPHGDDVRIYSRETDGTKGPHNKKQTSMVSLDRLTATSNSLVRLLLCTLQQQMKKL